MVFNHDENTMQQQLPVECAQHIFTYLELVDCLHFAATSSMSLQEVLPTIRYRRDRMTKTYAVVATKKTIYTTTTKYNACIGTLDELRYMYPDKDLFYEFPTLQQRVSLLENKIPIEHPMYKVVGKLRISLCNDQGSDETTSREKLTKAQKLIEQLKQIVLPLRLHATILKNTVLSKHCYEETTTSTTLQNYIGDVLCVTYLFYDFGTNYAAGSISPQWLMDKLHRYAPTCYQSWVLIHSSILRTKPFTKEQRIRLGLINGFEHVDSINNSLSPESILYSSSKLFGWNVNLLPIRTDQFVKSEMCLVYDDFGPLGPSFRGRDIVRVRDVSADAITECLLYYNNIISPTIQQHPLNLNNNNNGIRETIEWMCIVHQQAFLRRPMSVRLPIVRFSC